MPPDRACRVCFEGGGDLIAPCACRGSSRWIHRECLNSWRVRGSNPRALTNCCECGFQYRLVLCVTGDNDAEDRWRDMLRRLASQTFLGFLALQVAVLVLGLACHAVDRRELLAKLAGVRQDSELEPADLLHDLCRHKLVYYCAGIAVLAAALGCFAAVSWTCSACSGAASEPIIRRATLDRDLCGCQVCSDCLDVCGHECGGLCCGPGCKCGVDCPSSIGAGTQAIHLLLFLLVVGVLAGFFGAAVALVTSVQKMAQSLAELQERRFLVEEYVVQDLADLEHTSHLTPQLMPSEVADSRKMSEGEILQVFFPALPISYGSTASA